MVAAFFCLNGLPIVQTWVFSYRPAFKTQYSNTNQETGNE